MRPRSSALQAAALLLLCAGSTSLATDNQIPLAYNWNGMVQPGETGAPDAPAGFRAISDRALYIDSGNAHGLGTNPIVGTSGITYGIINTANVLDIVHLGNTGAGTARAWDAAANGDNRGIQPTWLAGLNDHSSPQVTTISPAIPLDSLSSIGVLYHVSNTGGAFDLVLGFDDATTVTVTITANDWFGATNPPAPTGTSGVATQTRLGATTFTGTSNTDSPIVQTWPAQALEVSEAVITSASTVAGGRGSIAGKNLASITFQNITQPNRGYAIFATTVVNGLGPPANDDCAHAQSISTGNTQTSNVRATGSTSTSCGTNDTSDVWYSYQAGASGPLEARTCGAGFDTTLAVYTACGGNAIACNDNGCGLASRLQWTATGGQTYLIRVAGNNAATGRFTLTIDANPAVHSDTPVPLTYNWNGMVHSGEDGMPDAPNGYRSISDRGLTANGAFGTINAGQLADAEFLPYSLQNQAGQLDMVHLGLTGPGSPRLWDPTPNGDGRGVQPDWLTTLDQSTPQRTDLAALNLGMGANTQVGVIYNVSNGGGTFSASLEFSDSSSATVTLQGPDWFTDQSPPGPGAGVAVQRQLGVYTATAGQDLATPGAPSLNVAEAVITTGSLNSGGFGDVTGRRLTGLTFSNPSTTTVSFAIYAATVRDGVHTCRPDVNGDGVVNVGDFLFFLSLYAAGDLRADMTGDGQINVNDFLSFLALYSAGC
jgi:hypothetical protein